MGGTGAAADGAYTIVDESMVYAVGDIAGRFNEFVESIRTVVHGMKSTAGGLDAEVQSSVSSIAIFLRPSAA